MRVSTILDTIGHTPHVRLHRLFDPRVEVWMKLERANPGGSIKDRIAMTMIAILSGQVGKSVLIDHFGWFGATRKKVNAERWLALGLIVVALVLIARG